MQLPRRCGSRIFLLLAASLTASCAGRQAVPASEARGRPPHIELPPALEGERTSYESEVASALDEVRQCFLSAGLDWPAGTAVDSVQVFETPEAAREALAAENGVPVESIPATFSGTVMDERLFMVSRAAYEAIWRSLYPEWSWGDRTYHGLIVHELTHKAHEAWAIAGQGSAEAMGPAWLFEGFAVVCAEQFASDEVPLSVEELRRLVGSGHDPEVSYPLYGRIVRSLATRYGMREVITLAARPGFPDQLLGRDGAGGQER